MTTLNLTLLRASEADIARFMSYVEKLPCGCWYWTGARSKGGNKKGQRKWYGSFYFKCLTTGKRMVVRAHRFASEVLGHAVCPPGYDRDHGCAFSMCVNPDHIEVVPKKINNDRKVERRRAAKEGEQCRA